MVQIRDKDDCRDEALALAQAVQTITQSPRYQELLDAFEDDDEQAARRNVRRILREMGVRQRIINKMDDDAWSPNSVSFRWV